MNNAIILLIFLLTATFCSVHAQNCPDIDLNFTQQSEIDQFIIEYPNCTEFQHTINIEGEDITNVHGLQNLRTVKGNVVIQNNQAISQLDGFHAIDTIFGLLRISNNDALLSMNVFSSIKSLYGGLYINHHDTLSEIEGFDSLRTVFNTYSVSYNGNLKNLPRIDTVRGIKNFSLVYNFELEELHGAYEFGTNFGFLHFSNNDRIKTFDGLKILSPELKRLSISLHDSLLTMEGFHNIERINGEFWITENNQLKNLKGNEKIAFIGQQMDIKSNNSLINFEGLSSLKNGFATHCIISNNPSLKNFTGLDAVEIIQDNFQVYNNNILQSFQGLNNLQYAEVLNVSNNDQLTDFSGLDKLDSINYLFVRENDMLQSFEGLNNLDIITNSVVIKDNPILSDISALIGLDSADLEYVQVVNNPFLGVCNIPLFCGFFDPNYNFQSEVLGNSQGCKSVNQLLISCGNDPIDNDNDGYDIDEDCDDFNETINPGMIEIPYNGLDDDCDSETFDDDLDQDGFVLLVDCNDMDSLINPGMMEIPYNGLDDDCDTLTWDDDLDQDGFMMAEDCNDLDSTINPLALEIPNNGIDENCDGLDILVHTQDAEITSFRISPNPFSEIIIIESEEPYDEIKVISPTGKYMPIIIEKNHIALLSGPAGLYVIQLFRAGTLIGQAKAIRIY